MVRRLAPLLLLAVAACTAAPAQEAGPANRSAGGETPTIVSLNPCSDAILVEVAEPQQILAISAYSHDPAGSSMDLATARRFQAVSGTVEEVLALKPDLVIGSTFTPPAAVHAMGRLGLRLERFGVAATVEESEAQVRQIAALAGHPERGEALIARIRAALAANRAPAGAAVSALVWQSGGIVPGDNTLVADLLRRTGFANAAAARGLGQADMLPLEQVLADPPRLIFAASHGAGNEDRMLAHPALAKLDGTRRETLDPALLWCGGPTIIRAAERLGQVRRSFRASTSSAGAGAKKALLPPNLLSLSLSKAATHTERSK